MECIQCGKVLEKQQKKFCCSACAATYNNLRRQYNTKGRKKIVNCCECGKEIEVGINSPLNSCKCDECKKKNRIQYAPPTKIYRPKNMTTKSWGNLNELLVAQYAVAHGISVSFPFGENNAYDQIWDVNGKLLKIQIKSPSVDETGFSIQMTAGFGSRKKHNYVGLVDYMVTYYNGECYCIEPRATDTIKLRTCLPRNGQTSGFYMAEDYTFEKQICPISITE